MNFNFTQISIFKQLKKEKYFDLSINLNERDIGIDL